MRQHDDKDPLGPLEQWVEKHYTPLKCVLLLLIAMFVIMFITLFAMLGVISNG